MFGPPCPPLDAPPGKKPLTVTRSRSRKMALKSCGNLKVFTKSFNIFSTKKCTKTIWGLRKTTSHVQPLEQGKVTIRQRLFQAIFRYHTIPPHLRHGYAI